MNDYQCALDAIDPDLANVDKSELGDWAAHHYKTIRDALTRATEIQPETKQSQKVRITEDWTDTPDIRTRKTKITTQTKFKVEISHTGTLLFYFQDGPSIVAIPPKGILTLEAID